MAMVSNTKVNSFFVKALISAPQLGLCWFLLGLEMNERGTERGGT